MERTFGVGDYATIYGDPIVYTIAEIGQFDDVGKRFMTLYYEQEEGYDPLVAVLVHIDHGTGLMTYRVWNVDELI